LVNVEAVDRFAREHREQRKGKWLQVERLGDFCLLLKREVLTKTNSLEPWTDMRLFDTDIMSAEAREAGYTLACLPRPIHPSLWDPHVRAQCSGVGRRLREKCEMSR
jgi:hypothetical protein